VTTPVGADRFAPCHDRYIIIWEFQVRPGSEIQFEQVYGPDGLWARLFRRGEGYIRTELLRDEKKQGRYLTLDYWVSRAAYERFREQRFDDYKRLDDDCERLTEGEVHLGSYEGVSGRR
jgi:heme-degrading monooxygenase HmoA